MTKEKSITLKIPTTTALEVLQVLDSATANYSKEFAPERVIRLRDLMSIMDQELEKALLSK